MNTNRHALRLAAPLALLLLAACTPQAQTANTAQQVIDAKNPGVVGAIKNAAGASTGNPETDAALGAGDVIENLVKADKLESEAVAARGKGEGTTAQEKITAAIKIRPNPYLYIMRMGIALQFGQGGIERDGTAEVLSTFEDKTTPQAFAYADEAIAEVERVLKVTGRMNLSSADRDPRRYRTIMAAAEFYEVRAAMYAKAGNQSAAGMDNYRKNELDQMLRARRVDDAP